MNVANSSKTTAKTPEWQHRYQNKLGTPQRRLHQRQSHRAQLRNTVTRRVQKPHMAQPRQVLNRARATGARHCTQNSQYRQVRQIHQQQQRRKQRRKKNTHSDIILFSLLVSHPEGVVASQVQQHCGDLCDTFWYQRGTLALGGSQISWKCTPRLQARLPHHP